MDQARIQNKILSDVRDKLGAMQGTLSAAQFAELLMIVSIFFEKPKGDPGDKGDDGHTPTREELLSLIQPLIPKPKRGLPGRTPLKGKDYYTEKDIKELIGKLTPLIHDYNEKDKKAITEAAIKKVQAGIKVPKGGIKAEEWSKIIQKINEVVKATSLKAETSNLIVGDGVRKITVASTAPTAPQEGDLWVDTSAL